MLAYLQTHRAGGATTTGATNAGAGAGRGIAEARVPPPPLRAGAAVTADASLRRSRRRGPVLTRHAPVVCCRVEALLELRESVWGAFGNDVGTYLFDLEVLHAMTPLTHRGRLLSSACSRRSSARTNQTAASAVLCVLASDAPLIVSNLATCNAP